MSAGAGIQKIFRINNSALRYSPGNPFPFRRTHAENNTRVTSPLIPPRGNQPLFYHTVNMDNALNRDSSVLQCIARSQHIPRIHNRAP